MVEKSNKGGPCDYQFEEICVDRKVFISNNGAASNTKEGLSQLNLNSESFKPQSQIHRQVFRVPILNDNNIGKVIEHSTPALPQKREQQSHGKREERGKKLAYTHFVSVPIATPELQKKYAEFQKLVTEENIPGIKSYAWQK